jgi:hypothetical protein
MSSGQEVTFFEKIPHSAFFYSRSDTRDPLQFKITREIPDSITTPFIKREKTYRKLKRRSLTGVLEVSARQRVIEGGWLVFTSQLK